MSNDYEDIEIVAPVLESVYRSAEVTLANFESVFRSRPPLLKFEKL